MNAGKKELLLLALEHGSADGALELARSWWDWLCETSAIVSPGDVGAGVIEPPRPAPSENRGLQACPRADQRSDPGDAKEPEPAAAIALLPDEAEAPPAAEKPEAAVAGPVEKTALPLPTSRQIREALALYPGSTVRQLGALLGCDRDPIGKRLAAMRANGHVRTEATEQWHRGQRILCWFLAGKDADAPTPAPEPVAKQHAYVSPATDLPVVDDKIAPERPAPLPVPATTKDDTAALIAAHIAAKGVTRCPTAVLTPMTQEIAIDPADAAAMRARNEALDGAALAERSARALKGSRKSAQSHHLTMAARRERAR